jgi:Domain of unknown function (DUF6916)
MVPAYRDFVERVGQTFAADGAELELVGCSSPQDNGHATAFTLTFVDHGRRDARQSTVMMSATGLSEFPIFLAPSSEIESGVEYVAVFNQLNIADRPPVSAPGDHPIDITAQSGA